MYMYVCALRNDASCSKIAYSHIYIERDGCQRRVVVSKREPEEEKEEKSEHSQEATPPPTKKVRKWSLSSTN